MTKSAVNVKTKPLSLINERYRDPNPMSALCVDRCRGAEGDGHDHLESHGAWGYA